MLDAFLQGGSRLFEPIVLLWILAGTLLGVVIGIIPAIGSLLAIALLIPFVYGMPPEIGLGFLVALASVVFTAGSMTSILLGIPGTGGNVATIFDGFMMTRKGEGPLAIGAALAASMFGGVIAVPMALVMIPLVVPLVVAFRTPEMFLLIALGLAFMGTVSVGSMVRGLISGLLGIMIALVGTNAMTGTQRFTFGSLFLYQGIDLVTIVLGLWGIAGLLDIMTKDQPTVSVSLLETKLSSLLKGVKLLWYHKLLWFRSSVIGYIVGIIPGIGASVATFMAYGQAKPGATLDYR